jgi:site-specific recombinase XerD
MFHQIFKRSHAIQRHLAAPLLNDRLRYLAHCAEQGTAQTTLRRIAHYQQIVIRYLRLKTSRTVTLHEIETAAARWGHHQARHAPRKNVSSKRSKARFINDATHWLRFLGHLKILATPPIAPQVMAFADYMRNERGLSEQTIQYRCHDAQHFLRKIRDQGHSLAHLTVVQVDAILIQKLHQGMYARRTIQTLASGLRAFFRYAESRDWCRAGLAAAIKAPRVYRHETIPSSPTWKEVQRLLKTTQGHHPTDIRDRGILLLLASYGLRAGEVRRLRLEDLDWDQEILHVTHSKNGRPQQFPLTQTVGQALLRYLKKARPPSACRELFLTVRAPFRPLGSGAVFQLVNRRFKPLHILIRHHGPHALRHACATRLINHGVSLKAIADQLGHRNLETTRIYAKVDLARLREVANFNLGGLL